MDDDLLAELAQDLVGTIRAGQDDVVRTPLDRVLIVRGGPGTGKTTTALRRVAWLVDEGLLDDAEALVVGPSAAFARYTDNLLTKWGYDRVAHRPIGELLPSAGAAREEAPHVIRLKGEARMARLLGRAVNQRHNRPPADLPASIDVGGTEVKLDPAALQRVVTTARASEAPADDRRRILRGVLAAGSDDPRLILAAADLLADQLWPAFDPMAFLRELFGSREKLQAAAAGDFTEREIAALCRPPSEDPAFEVWSEADLPLLDEAGHLVNGGPKGFAHVVVDEAQDLSPMQLRAVSRRSATGSMTVVGDIAQSTGPWARDDWHDLVAQLPTTVPHEHRELRYGYRVPRQIFDLAAELLPMAAPSVQAPTTVREGPSDPVVVPAGAADRAALVAAAAAEHEAVGRSVAVICPARYREEIEARLTEEELPWRTAGADIWALDGGVVLLGPHEAKGLEFEASVVVEPGHLLDDDPRGHRLLYIALTRATGYLHLIGAAEDLPMEFAGAPAEEAAPLVAAPAAAPAAPAVEREPEPEPDLDPAARETIDMVVQALAEMMLANLSPELWPIALRRLEQLINPS